MTEHFRQRVKGTNIDAQTLLSTDYLNHFNDFIMLVGLLPDAPELFAEVEAWEYCSYVEHFDRSNLSFAPLAKDAYPYVPPPVLRAFEDSIEVLRRRAEEAKARLRDLIRREERASAARYAEESAAELQRLAGDVSMIVHGKGALLQAAIDPYFCGT